jgi:hypothetical protein
MTALEEIGIVLRAVPGPRATADEIAHWYELKAQLLEHLAADDRAAAGEVERMRRQASVAHRHARDLLAA